VPALRDGLLMDNPVMATAIPILSALFVAFLTKAPRGRNEKANWFRDKKQSSSN